MGVMKQLPVRFDEETMRKLEYLAKVVYRGISKGKAVRLAVEDAYTLALKENAATEVGK